MKRYLIDELDKTIAFLGLIFALILIVWLYLAKGPSIYIIVGVLSFLACAGYLIIRKSISSSTLSSMSLVEGSSRLYRALNVLFFLLFAYSILSSHLRPDVYVRPLGYFVSVGLMVSVIAVEILFLPSGKWCNHFVLFKIVLIGLSLVFSQLLIFPGIIGIDPWKHQTFTLDILNSGHIPEGRSYTMLPLMHLMIGSTSLITGLSYKMATMLSISLLQVLLNTLATYLLGNFLFNKKVGLLASLLLAVANWSTRMSYWTIPNTIAPEFVLVITYLLLKVKEEKPHIAISLATFLMAALVLTHTVTAVWFTILLFTFWGMFKVRNYLYREQNHRSRVPKTPVTLTFAFFFLVWMLSWWTHASGHINFLARLIKWDFSLDYFISPMPEEVTQYVYNVAFSEQLFNQLGMSLFFAISLIGCLYMISKKLGNSHSFVMAIGAVITLTTGFLGPITGRFIVEARWWYFSQILLALPLAVAFFLFSWMIKNKLGKCLLIGSLTFSLSFLMIMSPAAILDNPTFSPNTQVRHGFTKSELQTIDFVRNLSSREIGVDTHYSNLRWALYPAHDISRQIYSRNYSDSKDMIILIREEILNRPIKMFMYTYKIQYDPREVLAIQGFSKGYDCGSVSGFLYLGKEGNA